MSKSFRRGTGDSRLGKTGLYSGWALCTALLAMSGPSLALPLTLEFGTGKPGPGETQSGYYNFYRGEEKKFFWQNTVKKDLFSDGYVQGHWDYGSCHDFACGQNIDPDFPVEPWDYDGSTFLGTDPTRCRVVDEAGEPLGPVSDKGEPIAEDQVVPLCGTPLKLSRGGLPFNVLSFIPVGSGIYNDKGAYADGLSGYLVSLADDPLWQGVKWIIIEGCGCGSPAGIDSLTVEIPEPNFLALAPFAIAAWACRRRR